MRTRLIGTVVGTASGSDVDVGDVLSYSLVDDAGGRFAIDSATGEITVADGSLLDHEAAASHDVVVQVTDVAGATYDETFRIDVGDVNEGPAAVDDTLRRRLRTGRSASMFWAMTVMWTVATA